MGDWIVVYEMMGHCGPLPPMTLVLFLFFFNFAILNLISGMFIEKALTNAEPDREALAAKRRKKEVADAEALNMVLMDMDDDKSGTLDFQEFDSNMQDPRIRNVLGDLGIEITDCNRFYDFLTEATGSQEILIEDFVRLCTSVRGPATAFEMASLNCEIRAVKRQLDDLGCKLGNETRARS